MQALGVWTIMFDFCHNLLTRVALGEAKLFTHKLNCLDVFLSNLTGNVIQLHMRLNLDAKMLDHFAE